MLPVVEPLHCIVLSYIATEVETHVKYVMYIHGFTLLLLSLACCVAPLPGPVQACTPESIDRIKFVR